MQQVTGNVFTSTHLRGCNPSFVVTSEGVVVIDTPQLPTKAVTMRETAESYGPIRYVVNTGCSPDQRQDVRHAGL